MKNLLLLVLLIVPFFTLIAQEQASDEPVEAVVCSVFAYIGKATKNGL